MPPDREDKPDPPDPRDLKDFRDHKAFEERWDPPETVVRRDLRAPSAQPEKMETQAVMAMVDRKEFKDRRVNADHRVFPAFRE